MSPHSNFTPFSSFSPNANKSPDKLVLSQRFTDQRGLGITVDTDIKLDVHKTGDPTPVITFTLTSDPAIERKVTSTGTYYFVQLDTSLLAGSVAEARWFGKLNGAELKPFPVVQHHDFPSSDQNILLAEEVRDWVLRKLGFPLVGVELTNDQQAQFVDDSLELYNRYIPKERFGEIFLIAGQTRYPITEFGRGVIDIQFVRKEGIPLISDPLFGREYPRGQQLDFDQYVLGTSFFESLLRITGQDPEGRWTPDDPGAIHINAHNQSFKVSYTFMVDHRLEEITPAHYNLFRRISLAHGKITLGNVRRKYSEIQAPTGNITLDGQKMVDEGEKELENITDDLVKLSPPTPPIYY